jgi:hypothetical protein
MSVDSVGAGDQGHRGLLLLERYARRGLRREGRGRTGGEQTWW